MRYDLIFAAATGVPWAIHPEKGEAIAEVLSRLAAGDRAAPHRIAEAAAAKKPKGKPRRASVAVLPIYGTITQRADLFVEWSGGTSTDVLGAQLDELIADASVEAIVLDVDSPGGSVYGVEELAMKIHTAGKQKKVVAVANSMAASAAYWLASQATEVVVTPNGEVGSIGVYMMHRDVSRALDTRGEKVTLVSAGERKTAGNPYGPLEGAGLTELQSGVDDYYDKFVRAVARGRNATLSAVRGGYGQGGMMRAEAAVKEGMVDRVGTLEQVLSRWGVKPADLMGADAEVKPDYEVELRKRRLRL